MDSAAAVVAAEPAAGQDWEAEFSLLEAYVPFSVALGGLRGGKKNEIVE